MDVRRWFGVGWAVGCPWDEATRVEARDFSRWIQLTDKPVRPHWRSGPDAGAGQAAGRPAPRSPNPVTGKPAPAAGVSTGPVADCETVLRSFYEFHLEARTGPMVKPFPLAPGGRAGGPP